MSCNNTTDSTSNNSQNMIEDINQKLIKANLRIERMTREINQKLIKANSKIERLEMELKTAHKENKILKQENEKLKKDLNACQKVETRKVENSEDLSTHRELRVFRKKIENNSTNDKSIVAVSSKEATVSISERDNMLEVYIPGTQTTEQLTPDNKSETMISTPDSSPLRDPSPINTMVIPKDVKTEIKEEVFEAIEEDQITVHHIAPPKRPSPCRICRANFKNDSQLANHLKEHVPSPQGLKQLYTCYVCSQTCFTPELLLKHQHKHKEEGYQCHMCKMKLETMLKLRRHVEKHFSTPMPCKLCDAEIPSLYSYQQHMKFHNMLNLTCLICKKKFTSRISLDSHLIAHRSTTEKPYKCKYCTKKYSKEHALTTHMLTHTGQKNFICDICKRSFYSKTDLRKHIEIHTKPKTLKCSDCDSMFRTNVQLRCHFVTMHTTETPFSCEHCDAKFKTKKRWKYHNQSQHTKERKFMCHICSRAFMEKSCLNKHIKLHSEERPFPCQYCDKRFKSKKNLNVHNGYFHKDVARTK